MTGIAWAVTIDFAQAGKRKKVGTQGLGRVPVAHGIFREVFGRAVGGDGIVIAPGFVRPAAYGRRRIASSRSDLLLTGGDLCLSGGGVRRLLRHTIAAPCSKGV